MVCSGQVIKSLKKEAYSHILVHNFTHKQKTRLVRCSWVFSANCRGFLIICDYTITSIGEKKMFVPYKVHINSFTGDGDEQTPSQASAFHNTKENFASTAQDV